MGASPSFARQCRGAGKWRVVEVGETFSVLGQIPMKDVVGTFQTLPRSSSHGHPLRGKAHAFRVYALRHAFGVAKW